MTALRPIESHEVTAVTNHEEERKLLRGYVLSTVCCHPECNRTDVTAHHLFSRSKINDSSWFVRIPGEDKPVLHVAGLCGSGTTGHHGDVEEHRGWVRVEDGVWNWYERTVDADSPRGFGNEGWGLVGPLDPQPGKHTRKARKREKQPSRSRKTVTVNVPQDEQEDGAGVLDELISVGRDQWAEEMGWSSSVPAYHVVVNAFVRALQ